MDIEARVWKIFSIVVALLTCLAPIYVVYDLYHKGSIPPKQLKLIKQFPINPLWDLSPLGDRVSLKLSIDNNEYNNIVIAGFVIVNNGETPIVPGDFYEPITVTTMPPWEIIRIENNNEKRSVASLVKIGDEAFIFNRVELKWTKLSNYKFEAKPTLINPGDEVSQLVYLTNTEYKDFNKIVLFPEIDFYINARIVNLKNFSAHKSDTENSNSGYRYFMVHVYDWNLLFLVVVAIIFISWYLILLRKSQLLLELTTLNIFIILLFVLLSFSVAEVITFFIFGGYPSRDLTIYGPEFFNYNWQNILLLVIHIFASVYLYRRASSKA